MDTYIHDHFQFPAHLRWWLVALDNIDLPVNSRAATKQYGEWFSPEELPLVQALSFFINPNLSTKVGNDDVFQVLRNIGAFPNLKFLSIPADAIEFLDVDGISPNLEYLRISSSRTIIGHEQGIAKNLLLPENTFPKLKSLYLYFPPSCYRNFDVRRFPNLQWLEVDLELDKTAKSLKQFRDLPSLQGLSLNGVHKNDILNDLKPSLIALDFWNIRTRSLNLSLLTNFQNLKYLTIRGQAEFDAAILSGLSQLSELQLWSLKSFAHAEALLRLSSLDRVSFRNIAQNSLTPEMREALRHTCSYVEFS